MPEPGVEEGGEADDGEVEGAEEAALGGVAELVADVVGGELVGAVDGEHAEGDGATHLARGPDLDPVLGCEYEPYAALEPQHREHDVAQQHLRQLPQI